MDQLSWGAGKPGAEDPLLSAQSDTDAYYGSLTKARDFSRRAVDSAIRADSNETAALWQVNAALREAEFGNAAAAKQGVTVALALAPGRDVKVRAALALARESAIPRGRRHWSRSWRRAIQRMRCSNFTGCRPSRQPLKSTVAMQPRHWSRWKLLLRMNWASHLRRKMELCIQLICAAKPTCLHAKAKRQRLSSSFSTIVALL